MSILDWVVLSIVLLGIVAYGIYKTREINTMQSYLQGDRDLPWWTIGLSIMATQASAITFLSTPGQAFESGMGFAQFYFGMPVAMVLLCMFVLPIYYKLNVYTAYEYLESRFDLKTRSLTALLFLVQRGLAAGLTIYAPSIILSNIMGWSLNSTIFLTGLLVILYTVSGGTKAVSVTQKQQMIVILAGMVVAAVVLILKLPEDISFGDAVGVAGKMGKLEVVDFKFDLSNRYTFWSGMLGGVFLFLSYFGTDQSQVQRYISGRSLTESRLGLIFNGLVKVPMQFLILFVGILVFLFFQFVQPPIHYNNANLKKLEAQGIYESELTTLKQEYGAVFQEKQTAIREMITAIDQKEEAAISQSQTNIASLLQQEKTIQSKVDELIKKADVHAETNDSDYIFITFITNYLPKGLIGLLLAVIFCAAMSSSSSELNALATTTMVDIYRRSFRFYESDQHYLRASKWLTVLWGVLALLFAASASLFDNLIEAVNIVGSLFYGSILGIFLVAFFFEKLTNKARFLGAFTGAFVGTIAMGLVNSSVGLTEILVGGSIGAVVGYFVIQNTFRRIGGTTVFIAAFLAEIIVIAIFLLERNGKIEIAYLWLNLIGCMLVVLFSWLIQFFVKDDTV